MRPRTHCWMGLREALYGCVLRTAGRLPRRDLRTLVALLRFCRPQSIVEKGRGPGLPRAADGSLRRASVTVDALKMSGLLGWRRRWIGAGRRAWECTQAPVCLPPSKEYLTSADYDEPHRCGEVLVAAVLEHIPGHLGQTPASPRPTSRSLERRRAGREARSSPSTC